MIEGLRPYAAYKESGLRSVGSVPAHWDVARAKVLFHEVDERSPTGSEQMLSVSHISGVRRRSELNVSMFLAESNAGHKRCKQNDIVINTMWAWMGALGVSSHDGLVSPSYGVYRPRDAGRLLPTYVDSVLRTPAYVAEYRMRSTGIQSSRLRLYPDQFLRLPLPVPSLSEQAAIVRFLDHTNHRIDRYIRAKRKLIALLNEQKHAIIHRAVTRGLNPNVPMKETHLPYVASIPAHWTLLALKRTVRSLIDCEHKTAPVSESSDLRVVRTTAVRGGLLRLWGTYETTPQAFRSWTSRGRPMPGDVIFTREAPAGEACVVPDDMNLCLGQRTVLIRPREHCLSANFLVHTIYAGPPRVLIGLASQGSTVVHFNMSDIGDLPIALPPFSEQCAIVSAIAGSTGSIDVAIAHAEREIALMREYRTRLIADVVTGQLDVREAARNLPDPAFEPDAPIVDDLDDDAPDDETLEEAPAE